MRRPLPAQPSWHARWFNRPGAAGAWGVALMFLVLAAGMDIYPLDPLPYRRGQYVQTDIRARLDFKILDQKLLDDAMRSAGSRIPATFRLNADLLKDISTTLEKVPTKLEAAKSPDKIEPDLAAELDITPTTKQLEEAAQKEVMADELLKIKEFDKSKTKENHAKAKTLKAEAAKLREQAKQISKRNAQAFASWVALAKPQTRASLVANIENLTNELRLCYVVRPDRRDDQLKRAAVDVRLVEDKTIYVQNVGDLVAWDKISRRIAQAIADAGFPEKIRPGIKVYLLGKLQSQPIYLYDGPLSTADRDKAIEAVQTTPLDSCYRHYEEGKVLARQSRLAVGEDQSLRGLSEEELALLRQEHNAYLRAEREGLKIAGGEANSNLLPISWLRWLRLTSRVAIVIMLTGLLIFYIVHYQFHVVEQNYTAFVLAMLLLVAIAVAKITVQSLGLNPYVSMLAVCIAGIILAISFDQRFALAIGAILAAFVVLSIRGNFSMLVVMMGGLFACVFQLHEIRTRSKVMIVSTVSAVAVFAVVWAISIKNNVPWQFSLTDSLWAAGSVILAGLIVQSLLPVIERIFRTITGSTLLEWCDASTPLLKRLAMDSPGTYNHSLQLGAMCEAAAETIGARGLLARVGAYYHDIGKINKPDYFSENQAIGENKHSKLSPAMSLLLIFGHVKDGLEMARQYGLPAQLREFIATHHGTTLVRYFYHAASQKAQAENAPAPDESQYRYSGPKPHSREAAVLMLADGAESSVRSMTEPTPSRIRAQVHSIVTDRLEDGQLDDCQLTLREVHKVEESIVKSLCGMYHGRIAYPEDKKTEDKEGKKEEPQTTSPPEEPRQPKAENKDE